MKFLDIAVLKQDFSKINQINLQFVSWNSKLKKLKYNQIDTKPKENISYENAKVLNYLTNSNCSGRAISCQNGQKKWW